MSYAKDFVRAWHDQAKTTPAKKLAQLIDPKVKITRNTEPFGFCYDFSDRSIARTEGKGSHFKIWCHG